MKTWTNPTIEELDVKLTAEKGDDNHCEYHKPGKGHGGDCLPGCEGYQGWDDNGTIVS